MSCMFFELKKEEMDFFSNTDIEENQDLMELESKKTPVFLMKRNQV